ncbi:PLP-dependent aminotransferase family protein [Actinoplanes oblitus]|uniref:PLP-dependent aminotransferase family protein n=1 Tax=Actinoplanes oblitus TaxID=3040509 RepID=A0ABY8WB93_9ACTN|nr:PLP-dependent aminotransferase family protein [Actinoplanes oblitus]WIM94396.1 PLP-dependent aminotransferase family protein [Actinoplanes oblitus]
MTGADIPIDELNDLVTAPIAESMNFLNEIAQEYPDAVSFAAGRPYEGYFDLDDVHRYLDVYRDHVRARFGGDERRVTSHLMQYGRTKGIINDLVARNLAVDEKISVDPEAIVVTVGCQEALYLTLRALRRTDRDAVLAVMPSYVGMAGAAHLADMPLVPVDGTAGALRPDRLVTAIEQARAAGLRPRAVYVMADFANPSGASLGLADRRDLLEVSAEHDVLLLEDNPYGLFHGDREQPPTLKALDTDRRVVYLGTFAKTCMPGTRVGYVVADQTVGAPDGTATLLADEIAKLKSMLTVNTPPLAQAVIGGRLLAHDGSLRAATARERRIYQANLAQLLAGLERRFPPGSEPAVTWNRPDGGFFLTLTVPFPAGDDQLRHSARAHDVLWMPMHHFHGDGRPRPTIRLSFSHLSPAQIELGLDRLAAFVAEQHRS